MAQGTQADARPAPSGLPGPAPVAAGGLLRAFDPRGLGYAAQWSIRLALLFADTLFIGRSDRGTDAFSYILMAFILAAYLAAFLAVGRRAAAPAPSRRLLGACVSLQAALVLAGLALVALASLGSLPFGALSSAAGALLGLGLGLSTFEWVYLFFCRGEQAARAGLVSSWLAGAGLFAVLMLLPSVARLAVLAALALASAALERGYLGRTPDTAAPGVPGLAGAPLAPAASAQGAEVADMRLVPAARGALRPSRPGGRPGRSQSPARAGSLPRSGAGQLAAVVAAVAALGFVYGTSGPIQLLGGGASTGDLGLMTSHMGTLLVASLAASLILLAFPGRAGLPPLFLAGSVLDACAAVALPFVGAELLPLCAGVFGMVNRVAGMVVLYSCATIPSRRLFFRTAPLMMGAPSVGLMLGVAAGNALFAAAPSRSVALLVATIAIMSVLFASLAASLVLSGGWNPGGRVAAAGFGAPAGDGGPDAALPDEPRAAAQPAAPAGRPSGQPPASSELDARALSAMAALYGLSEREAEVLSLLSRGRGTPFVAEQLGLSQNTVKAYARSLYKKLGVHSREELMDLAEEFGRGSAGRS